MTIEQLRAALRNANVAALLRVIREGESTQDERAYLIINGGGHFNDFSRHPYAGQSAPPGKAAGAYQFIPHTWQRLEQQYGFADFSPTNQDLGAVALIAGHDALDDIIAGRLVQALTKLRPVWTSLPGAAENTRLSLAKARYVYEQWGGHYAATTEPPAEQPAARIEDIDLSHVPPRVEPSLPSDGRIINPDQGAPAMADDSNSIFGMIGDVAASFIPGGPLVKALAGKLIGAFAPLVKEKITSTLGRHDVDPAIGGQVADSLVQAAMELTKQSDPVDAVSAATKNAAIMAQLEQSALDHVKSLVPIIDKINQYEKDEWSAEESSRDAAKTRAKDESVDLAKPLIMGMLVMMGWLVVFVSGIAAFQVWKTGNPGVEVWAALTGLIGFATGVATTVFAYRFGSSRSSAAKDVANAALMTQVVNKRMPA